MEEYLGVRLAWKRIIAIAKNLPDPALAPPSEQYNETEPAKNSRLYAMSEASNNMFIITSQVEGFIAFISILTKELDYNCPTSVAFVRLIIERSGIPTPITLKTITAQFIDNHKNQTESCKINQYLLWSILAQQFAGNLSYSMWSDAMYDLLIASITSSSSHPTLQLYALLVFESFALNGHLKQLFMERRLNDTLQQINQSLQPNKWKKLFAFCASRSDEWIETRQFRFALEWSMSQIFAKNPDIRVEQYSKAKVVNYYKQRTSQSGLEVRNDHNQFETIQLSDVLSKGRWYFEVQILTNGIIQVGLCASKGDIIHRDQGFGIGHDSTGFAFDSYQSGIWLQNELKNPKNPKRRHRCSKGDVIGCLIDFENEKCIYYVNGQVYSVYIRLGELAKEGVIPVIQLAQFQHAKVNSGSPWFHKSPKNIKPLKLSVFMNNSIVTNHNIIKEDNDLDEELCTLCFSEEKGIVLLPCCHGGFGDKCAEKLKACPLCRAPIKEIKAQHTPFDFVAGKNSLQPKFQL